MGRMDQPPEEQPLYCLHGLEVSKCEEHSLFLKQPVGDEELRASIDTELKRLLVGDEDGYDILLNRLTDLSRARESHKGTETTPDSFKSPTRKRRDDIIMEADMMPDHPCNVSNCETCIEWEKRKGTGEGETLDRDMLTIHCAELIEYAEQNNGNIDGAVVDKILQDREQYADLKASKAISEFKLWISSNDKSGEDDRDYVIDSGDLLLYGIPGATKEKL